jgi:hypothetical protein
MLPSSPPFSTTWRPSVRSQPGPATCVWPRFGPSFHYAAYEEPAHASQIQRVLAIPGKHYSKRLVQFLNPAETEALLAAPDQRTWHGRRDYTLAAGRRSNWLAPLGIDRTAAAGGSSPGHRHPCPLCGNLPAFDGRCRVIEQQTTPHSEVEDCVAFATLCDGRGASGVVFAANTTANEHRDETVPL